MTDNMAPGQQATAGKEVPKGPGNNGPIPFDRKGEVKPVGKGWSAVSGEINGRQGIAKGRPVNVS
jgi:hypothetical protein